MHYYFASFINMPNTLKCKICSWVASSNSILEVHLRVHTGEKPFSCDVCGQSFTQDGSLNAHKKRKHDDDGMRFSCKVCKKKFFHRGDLTRHALMHWDIKRFECNYCKNKYTRKFSLKEHIDRVHCKSNKANTFKCDICSSSFYRKWDLKKHLLVVHKFNDLHVGKSSSNNLRERQQHKHVRDDYSDLSSEDSEGSSILEYVEKNDTPLCDINNTSKNTNFNQTDSLQCVICDIKYTSRLWYYKHLKSRKHKYKENMQQEINQVIDDSLSYCNEANDTNKNSEYEATEMNYTNEEALDLPGLLHSNEQNKIKKIDMNGDNKENELKLPEINYSYSTIENYNYVYECNNDSKIDISKTEIEEQDELQSYKIKKDVSQSKTPELTTIQENFTNNEEIHHEFLLTDISDDIYAENIVIDDKDLNLHNGTIKQEIVKVETNEDYIDYKFDDIKCFNLAMQDVKSIIKYERTVYS